MTFNQTENSFEKTIVEEVLKLRYKKNLEYSDIWTTLRRKYGTDCGDIWQRITTEAMICFRELFAKDDNLKLIHPSKLPTLLHWRVLIGTLIKENDDMAQSTREAEQRLLTLVVDLGLEPTLPSHKPMWEIIQNRYSVNGYICPAVVLQTRFVRWLRHSRCKLWARWRALIKEPQPAASDIFLPAIMKYSSIMSSSRCLWSDFVDADLVTETTMDSLIKLVNEVKMQLDKLPQDNKCGTKRPCTDEHKKIPPPVFRVQPLNHGLQVVQPLKQETYTNPAGVTYNTILLNPIVVVAPNQPTISQLDGQGSDSDEEPIVKIELENETITLFEEENSFEKPPLLLLAPNSPSEVAPNRAEVTINTEKEVETDLGEIFPSAFLRVTIVSLTRACALNTCCLARRLLLNSSYNDKHPPDDCRCCCLKRPKPTQLKHLSLEPFYTDLNHHVTFTTNFGTVQGVLRGAHEFNSVCPLELDQFVKQYQHIKNLIAFPDGKALKIDNYLIVTDIQPQDIKGFQNIYVLGERQTDIRRLLLDNNQHHFNYLSVEATTTNISHKKIHIMYCGSKLKHKAIKTYKVFIPLPAEEILQVWRMCNVYLLNMANRAVIPVRTVQRDETFYDVLHSEPKLDIDRWIDDKQLRKEIKSSKLHLIPQDPVILLEGQIFPGPTKNIQGVSKIMKKCRLYANERALNLQTLNLMPKCLPIDKIAMALNSLSTANKSLLSKVVPDIGGEETVRSKTAKKKRVTNNQIYRIR